MSQPRPVTTHGHPYGKPLSWTVVVIALAAFAAGGIALIRGWWWLFFVMIGVFGACVPAGAAVGMMGDTVGWTAPLSPETKTVRDAASRPERGGRTCNTAEPDQPDEFGEHPESDS